jgi:transposase
MERGITVRQGATALRLSLPEILSTRSDTLSPQVVRLIEDLCGDWRHLDTRVRSITAEIEVLAEKDEHCRRLMTSPGVGPITSSAMVSAIGTGVAFKNGRNFAAWLGLVPKQISTGGRTILGGITKRGNRYLRTLFIQGASRSRPKHGFGGWLEAASRRLHSNVLVVALAAKLARIAWSMLATQNAYDSSLTTRTA